MATSVLKPSACEHQVHLITSSQSTLISMPLVVSPTRLSSWTRLLRATARAHKFIYLLRQPSGQKDLTFADLRQAEVQGGLRQSQIDSFLDELNCLKNNRPLPHKSKVKHLNLYVGEDQLIRLSGRINRVLDVDEEAKRPILLDSKHPAVRLLIAYFHNKTAHANTETVVNEIRQLYWVNSLRNTVKSIASDCRFCRLIKAKPCEPPMGDLPQARLAHNRRAFSFVRLDYFGPLQVSVGRRREKRYVALYTCLVTRALHLEVVYSLSTDAAIMSLRRFIARRGTPTEIWSDNGTAFVGAKRLLKTFYDTDISKFAVNELIDWKYIPPAAPFMGGAWERLVRSVKTTIRITLYSRTLTDEVFQTFLLEAEGIINSRPLVHVSTEPDCDEALTPFHFILGSSSGRSLPATLSDSDLVSRAGWRKAVRLADHFWCRWVREYLPTLTPRRNSGITPSLKIGDVVLLADGTRTMPRGTWPRGRVIQLYSGKDGIIRVADVMTSAGPLKRPLKKLISLA